MIEMMYYLYLDDNLIITYVSRVFRCDKGNLIPQSSFRYIYSRHLPESLQLTKESKQV